MDYTKLYEEVLHLPQEMRDIMVIELLADEKVSYDVVSRGYVKYINNLKEKQTEEYNQLTQHILEVYIDYKKNRDKNIDSCIRFLWNKGRINLSSKQIDKLK